MNTPRDSLGGNASHANDKTPNADMQLEDAGTADSAQAAQGEPARGAMKQPGKTQADGSGRPAISKESSKESSKPGSDKSPQR